MEFYPLSNKKKDSKYELGKRSHKWLINYQYATVEIAGFRKSEFGWLLRFPDGKPSGFMELGVPAEARKVIYQLAKSTGSKRSMIMLYLLMDCQTGFFN